MGVALTACFACLPFHQIMAAYRAAPGAGENTEAKVITQGCGGDSSARQ